MVDVDTKSAPVGTAEWFLARLFDRLGKRRSGLVTLDKYYEGSQPLKFAAKRYRQAFGKHFLPFSENICPLVVDTVEQRLDVVGFRIAGGGREGSSTSKEREERSSREAWDIWQRSQMDSESEIAHTEALTLGMSYALVWNADDDPNEPVITIESPHEMIVEHSPGSRWARAAALKAWRDDWEGRIHATLYTPDWIYKFQSRDQYTDSTMRFQGVRWERREPEDEPWPIPNELGRVPVVPLYNRPRLRESARSELADVLPSQDVINKLTADMIVAAEFAAFRQRVLIGVDPPRDPETGEVLKDVYKQALEAYLFLPKTDSKVADFEATDLTNYVAAIEHEIQKVATRTQTPPHYFFLRGEFPSGESIVAAEAGLVSKARRRMRHFEDAWEEVIQLALAVRGRAVPLTAIETIWRDPESRTEAQHIDAVGKKRQMLEVPVEQAWEDAGYSPQQIERMREQRAAEPQPQQLVLPTGTPAGREAQP